MNLHEVVNATLSQVKTYLSELSPAEYTAPLDILSGASLGQHTRHILEFYDCLLCQYEQGNVNYDLRKRDIRLETEPHFADQTIDDFMRMLTQVDPNRPLILAHAYGESDNELVEVSTTFARELLYNVEHAIHHLAMVKIGLKYLRPGWVLPPDFGVAPSTIRYRVAAENP